MIAVFHLRFALLDLPFWADHTWLLTFMLLYIIIFNITSHSIYIYISYMPLVFRIQMKNRLDDFGVQFECLGKTIVSVNIFISAVTIRL